MEGIQNFEQTKEYVRIELEADFDIVLNGGGMIVASPDNHAHLDWEAADQVARTILSCRSLIERKENRHEDTE